MPDTSPADWILNNLRCPISGEPLHWANATVLQQVNAQIESRSALTRTGDVVSSKVEAGVVNRSLQWFYPCHGSVLELLPADAIRCAG